MEFFSFCLLIWDYRPICYRFAAVTMIRVTSILEQILRITGLMDFVHRIEFEIIRKQRFGNWICFRLQSDDKATPTLSPSPHLKTESDQAFEGCVL
jgi:hypothetical protein